jgi:hypothetical protein
MSVIEISQLRGWKKLVTGPLKDVRAMKIADDFKINEISLGNPVETFWRLYPYDGPEKAHQEFNSTYFYQMTNILTEFFTQEMGNPDKAHGGLVELTIRDYKGTERRTTQYYPGGQGVDIFVLIPTRDELKTTIIPAQNDPKVLLEHPVATILACRAYTRRNFILSGRMLDGKVYPRVNDFGAIFALDEITDVGGTYIHHKIYNLNHLKEIFHDNTL